MNRHRHESIGRGLVAAVALGLAIGPTAAAQTRKAGSPPTKPVETAECRRVTLAEPRPSWSISAAWDWSGEELLVVDLAAGRLLRYDATGTVVETIARPGLGRFETNRPTELMPTDDGYLLADGLEHLIWLDHDLEPTRALDFRGRRGRRHSDLPPGLARLQLVSRIPIGDRVIGHGAVQTEDGTITQGWLHLDAGGSLIELRADEDQRPNPYESLLIPLVARAGGVVYALRYDGSSFLERLHPGRRRLTAFPEGFERLPTLPDADGPASAALLYRAVQEAALPTALYGRGDRLYLLTREPADDATRWRLSVIDPRADALLRTLTLPTSAAHVFLAPGPVSWAVMEKGPVIRSGEQPVPSVVLLPAEWIEDPGSKELADGHDAICS